MNSYAPELLRVQRLLSVELRYGGYSGYGGYGGYNNLCNRYYNGVIYQVDC